jgi:hypothetical protein
LTDGFNRFHFQISTTLDHTMSLLLFDKNKLVRTRRFAGDPNESEGAVEGVCFGVLRPQPKTSEVIPCRPHDYNNQLITDSSPSIIDGDIKVADPTDQRISDVGFTVQPTHTDDLSVIGGDENGFSWLVETVPTTSPVFHQADKTLEANGSRFHHQVAETVDR